MATMGTLIQVEPKVCPSQIKTVSLNLSGHHSWRQSAYKGPSHQQDGTSYDSDTDPPSDGILGESAYSDWATSDMYRGHHHPATYATAQGTQPSTWYAERSESLQGFLANKGLDEPRQADLEEWLRQVEDRDSALLKEIQDLQDDKAGLTNRLNAAYDMIDDMTRDYEVYSRSMMELHTRRSGELWRLEQEEGDT